MKIHYTEAELAFVIKHFMPTVSGKAENALKAIYNENMTKLKAVDMFNVSLLSVNENCLKLDKIKTTLKLFKLGNNNRKVATLEEKLKKLVILLDDVAEDTMKLSYLPIDKVKTSEDVFAVAQAGGLKAVLNNTSSAIEEVLDSSILLSKLKRSVA